MTTSQKVTTGAATALVAAASIIGIATRPQHKTTLTWNASTTPGVTYTIYRGVKGKPAYFGVTNPTPLITGLTATTYVDSTVVVGGGPYSYAVCAVNNALPHLMSCESPEVRCDISTKKCAVGAAAGKPLAMCEDQPLLLRSQATHSAMLDYMQRYDTHNCRFVIDDSPTQDTQEETNASSR